MTVVLVLSGEYDISVQEQLSEDLEQLYSEPQVVLNFTGVDYVDSSCLTELVKLHNHRQAHNLNRVTIVVKPGSNVLHVFDMVGLRAAFDLVDSIDDAVAGDEPIDTRLAFPGSEQLKDRESETAS